MIWIIGHTLACPERHFAALTVSAPLGVSGPPTCGSSHLVNLYELILLPRRSSVGHAVGRLKKKEPVFMPTRDDRACPEGWEIPYITTARRCSDQRTDLQICKPTRRGGFTIPDASSRTNREGKHLELCSEASGMCFIFHILL